MMKELVAIMRKMKNSKKVAAFLLLSIFLLAGLTGCSDDIAVVTVISGSNGTGSGESAPADIVEIAEDGIYDSKDDVALYIDTYGHLPDNYITKATAKKAGWPGGELEKYCPGKCIGGDKFGNYEEILPDKKGRTWYECDIDTLGATARGAKRIVYSNDGLIYYTEDHYESFELLYGEP